MFRDHSIRILRYLIRIYTVSLILNIILAASSDWYFMMAVETSLLGPAFEIYVMMASTVVLPSCVGLEIYLHRTVISKSERVHLFLDSLLVFIWFGLFWGVALYGLTHFAFI